MQCRTGSLVFGAAGLQIPLLQGAGIPQMSWVLLLCSRGPLSLGKACSPSKAKASVAMEHPPLGQTCLCLLCNENHVFVTGRE